MKTLLVLTGFASGFLIGFPLGFFLTKNSSNEEDYPDGFSDDSDVAKGDFCNSETKD